MLVSTRANHHRSVIGLLYALIATLFFVSASTAEEVILSFDADIVLQIDGSVDVVETITVRAEAREIRRGIFRDIPTVLENDDGSLLRSDLDVLDVQRDGEAEPFFTEAIANGQRIYIGQSDVFIQPGIYSYTIHYTMTRMARRFDDFDEIYWNATGNFWTFPIESATATVTLPDGARIETLDAYTGDFGSIENDADMRRVSPNKAVFQTKNSLASYEGMSVAVSFQKGVLSEVSTADKARYFISDHRDKILSAIFLGVVLIYYLFAWNRVGRDPEKGPIIPRFYPPKNLSPALVHYISEMGWRGTGWQAFTAAMISLAAKGHLEISQSGKKTTLIAQQVGLDERPSLPPGETVIYDYLDVRGSVTIDKTTGPGLGSAKTNFTSALQAESQHAYFRNNVLYVVFGVFLSIAAIVFIVVTGALAVEWVVLTVFLSILASVTLGLLSGFHSGSGTFNIFRIFIAGVAGINFFALIPDVLRNLSLPDISAPAISVVSIIALNVLFAMIMRAPTVQGRKLMDEIEGFRMYLETAEKERLNFTDEPELTTTRFERILPYAIALGVEKPWSEHFQSQLARHAVPDARGDYSPSWYHGSNFSSGNLSRDVSALSSGMSKSMIASQPAPSSSSGSSGGGSSGGGGGGGGGGGW